MSIEGEPSENKLEISYHPKDVISMLERNGHITDHSLMQGLECSDSEAGFIIVDLMQLGVISSSDDDWTVNEEKKTLDRVYRLTEAGRQKKDIFKQRRLELTSMPSLSRASMETTNDVLEAARAKGLDFDDLAEMMRTNDPKLSELFRQRMIAVLGEFSPKELIQLAEDLKLLERNPESNQ